MRVRFSRRYLPRPPHMPASHRLRQTLPALFVIYFGAFGLMLSGLSLRELQWISLGLFVLAALLMHRQVRWMPIMGPLLALTGVLAVAMLAAPDPADGLPQVVVWAAAVAVFGLSSAIEEELLGEAVFSVLAAIALIAVYQALNWWVRVDMLSLPPRLGSTLWNPNNLAPVMVAALALAAKTRRWFWLVVFLAALVFTGSVASMAVALLGASVFAALNRPRIQFNRAQWAGLGAAAATGVALAAIAAAQIARRSQRNLRASALEQRLDLWRVALLSFQRRPLSGLGPDSFQEAYRRWGALKPSVSYTHTHNLYLQAAAEVGVLGLLALGWLIAAAGMAVWRAHQAGKRRGAALGAALLATLLVHGLFDYVYWIPGTVVIILWVGRALLAMDDPPAPPRLPLWEWARSRARMAQVILIGMGAFRVTAQVDHARIALARSTTAMSAGLAFLLLLVITTPPDTPRHGE